MEIGGNNGNARDQTEGGAALAVMGTVLIMIEASEGRNGGADGVHRRRVLGNELENIDDAFGQFAVGGEDGFQFGQFLLIGQVVVMQQVNDLFVTHFAGQFIDVVSAINQFADFAANITQASGGSDNAIKAFGNRFSSCSS